MAKYAPNASGHEKMSQYDKKKMVNQNSIGSPSHGIRVQPYICYDARIIPQQTVLQKRTLPQLFLYKRKSFHCKRPLLRWQ